MELNLKNQHSDNLARGFNWHFLFGIIHIWKNRNLFIFQGLAWDPDSVIKVFLIWAKQYASVTNSCAPKVSRLIVNYFLSNSWVCLSLDGSVRQEDAFVASRGLLRDHNGGWIIGFNRYVGNCLALDYELWPFWMV